MTTLHVVPGASAGGGLIKALRNAGRDEAVLPFPDDFSYGPIDTCGDVPPDRWQWSRWDFCGSRDDHEHALRSFWNSLTKTKQRIVVWWGRGSPRECTFFMAIAFRLQERDYDAIDVTGMQYTFVARDGSPVRSRPAAEVSTVRHEGLESLLGTQLMVSVSQRKSSAADWRRLCGENAPFRVISDRGIVSVPIDHFDSLILSHVKAEWRPLHKVTLDIYCHSDDYTRFSTGMITKRLAVMVEDGRVLTDQYPLDVRVSNLRLPRTPG